MQIQCPHCHNPLEIEDPTTAEEVLCPACGSSFRLAPESTTAWSPADGQRKLGKFEILDAIGFGAFGTVFKARDPELDRIVAIKVPRAGSLATREDLNRFLREARSAAHLCHPAIVPIYEVNQSDSIPYLVSEFVQGMTLADLLTARRPTPEKAAALVADVADALQYAHEQHVIHRDVKPSNILLDNDNRPHLMDFGLAKRDAGEVTMTLDGQVLGTPAYMSPEQASGDAHKVDGRSDIYSLGVILYQLLTGELPFKGNARALMHQVQHDEPPPPRQWNKLLPRDLETICMKAMAKDRQRRYATAAALADDLRRFLRGEPILARRPGRIERSVRWCKRRRGVLAGTISAISLSLIVGLIVYMTRPAAVTVTNKFFAQLPGETTIFPTRGTSKPPAAKLAPLPEDLTLVPSDSTFFVSVRLSDVVQQEGAKRLAQEFKKYPTVLPSAARWESEFEKAYAQQPSSVERITFLPESSNQAHQVAILTTTKPFASRAILKRLGDDAKQKADEGKPYHVATKPRTVAAHFVSNRIFMLCDSEVGLKAFFKRKPPAAAPAAWQSTLNLAARRYEGVVGVTFHSPNDWASVEQMLPMFPGGRAITPQLDILKQMQSAFLLFNLRSGTLSGDRLELRLRLVFADAAQSEQGAKAVREVLARLGAPLQQIIHNIAKDPNTLKMASTRSGMPPEALRWMFEMVEQLALGFQDLEIKTDGNVVDVPLPYLSLDVAGLGTFLAESARMSEQMTLMAGEDSVNLVRIGLALEDYVDAHKQLPPSAIFAADRRPLLSWRVALLPYLGHKELYQQFKLDEPWDGPHNKTLLARMPDVYRSSKSNSGGTTTAYRAIVGPGAAFEGTKGIAIQAITDGPGQTIAIIRAPTTVDWTKPEEVAYSPSQAAPALGRLAVFADGVVRQLGPVKPLDERAQRALVTRSGGEKIEAGNLSPIESALVAGILNDQCWNIVRQPGSSSERYRWALRRSQAACRLAPNNGPILNTLGVAQYRTGRFEDALATLARSQALDTALFHGPLVADLTFQAMCYHQRGQKEMALDYLRRARQRIKGDNEAKQPEDESFLHEAETLIAGQTGAADKQGSP